MHDFGSNPRLLARVALVIRALLLGMVTGWALVRGWEALGERAVGRRLRAALVEALGYDPLNWDMGWGHGCSNEECPCQKRNG